MVQMECVYTATAEINNQLTYTIYRFRWVACQMEELKFCSSHKTLFNVLKRLPKTLEDIYDQILQSINERVALNVKVLLQWMVFAIRPLKLYELAVVIAFDPDTAEFDSSLGLAFLDDVLAMCSSLVTRADADTIVLAHASVREYFLGKPRSIQQHVIFCSDGEASHSIIAHCCLQYLLQERWSNHETEITSGINHFPLENYSMQYWPDHYKLSNKSSDLHKLVSGFVQDDNVWFKKWARQYQRLCFEPQAASVTTWYGLLHYDYLIRRTGPFVFLFNLLNLATPL